MLASNNKSTDDGTPTTPPPDFGGNFRLQVLSAKKKGIWNYYFHSEMTRRQLVAAAQKITSHRRRHTSLSKATTERDTTIMADEAPPEIPEVCFVLSCVCKRVNIPLGLCRKEEKMDDLT
jgi:hypothetical protein